MMFRASIDSKRVDKVENIIKVTEEKVTFKFSYKFGNIEAQVQKVDKLKTPRLAWFNDFDDAFDFVYSGLCADVEKAKKELSKTMSSCTVFGQSEVNLKKSMGLL